MAVESSGSPALDELSYREIQSKLKYLGLPAKGPDQVLRERLSEALAEGKITLQDIGGVTSPPSSPPVPQSPRRRRTIQADKSPTTSPKRERFIITTEVKSEGDIKRQSQRIQTATKAALPEANVKVKRVVKEQVQSPGTPIDRIKKFATDSASKLQKSANKVQRQIKKQKLSRWWPAGVALLVLVALLAGAWGARQGRASWQRQISRQMDSMQESLESLYQGSQRQAARVGNNAYQGYGYVQDSLSSGTNRLSRSASQAWDTGALYVDDTYDKALQYLPSFKKFRAALPTFACSSRLNATLMNAMLPKGPEWDGLKLSLQDVWKGLKDEPLKGTGVLLAGQSQAALKMAAKVIESAVPSDCKQCYLHIKGYKLIDGIMHSAGSLQLELFQHLKKCPNAIIHIENVAEIHAELLPVLLAVLSEQGGLTLNGKTIPSYRALYIGSIVAPPAVLAMTDEQQFKAAVKRDMVLQLEFRHSADTQSITAEAFRRRWDYTAPLQ